MAELPELPHMPELDNESREWLNAMDVERDAQRTKRVSDVFRKCAAGLILFGLTANAVMIAQVISGVFSGSFGAAGAVADPGTDAPGAGTYAGAQSISFSGGTSGVTRCYTVDGATPGAASAGTCDSDGHTQTYSSSFTSPSSTFHLKYLGTKAGLSNSGVTDHLYTITAANPTVNSSTCAANHQATSPNIACTFSSPPASGSTIVVFVSYYDFATTTMVCADDHSNTYTPPTNSTKVATGVFTIKSFAATGVTTGGSFTVTCTYGGGNSTYEQILAYEVQNGTAVDQSAVTSGASSAPSVGPVTTTAATSILAAFIGDTAGLTYTHGNICSSTSTDGGGVAKNDPPTTGLRGEYANFSTTKTSCSAVMSINNGDDWAGALIAVK